jgi:hypothetical protein
VNEEKNAARKRAIQNNVGVHQRSQECLQTSPNKRKAFVQKKTRQLDKEVSIEIERHRSIQDSRIRRLSQDSPE